MDSGYPAFLARIFEVQDRVASLHPCLEHLYPVAVAEGNELAVYDVNSSGRRYDFVARVRVPMTLPDKIRAAFPLEDFGGRMAYVVTGDAFSTIEGYVEIFHEFVHCYQFEQCENDLKQTLGVATKARAENDYMWEINYPFPYEDPRVCQEYSSLLELLESADPWLPRNSALGSQKSADYEEVSRCRKALRDTLDGYAFEYMVWQEWKEGFARYIENRIRNRLGLPLNLGGRIPPFSRVSFYAGGAALIGFLADSQPEVVRDLRHLFSRLMEIGAADSGAVSASGLRRGQILGEGSGLYVPTGM